MERISIESDNAVLVRLGFNRRCGCSWIGARGGCKPRRTVYRRALQWVDWRVGWSPALKDAEVH